MTRVHAPGGNLGHFLFWVLGAPNSASIAARRIVTKISLRKIVYRRRSTIATMVGMGGIFLHPAPPSPRAGQ
jgi:hypothetical protein